jgi:hypothetical protein
MYCVIFIYRYATSRGIQWSPPSPVQVLRTRRQRRIRRPDAADRISVLHVSSPNRDVFLHTWVGIIYMTVPTAVNPTPTHHHRSAFNSSVGFKILCALRGLCFSLVESFMSRLALLLAVFVTWPATVVDVGFRVEVGSICGGW